MVPLGGRGGSQRHVCVRPWRLSQQEQLWSAVTPGVRMDPLWCVLAAAASKERRREGGRAEGRIVPAGATTLLREAEDEFFSFQKRASLSIQRNKVSYFKQEETAPK